MLESLDFFSHLFRRFPLSGIRHNNLGIRLPLRINLATFSVSSLLFRMTCKKNKNPYTNKMIQTYLKGGTKLQTVRLIEIHFYYFWDCKSSDIFLVILENYTLGTVIICHFDTPNMSFLCHLLHQNMTQITLFCMVT